MSSNLHGHSPRTRCCGTRAWAAGGVPRPLGPRLTAVIRLFRRQARRRTTQRLGRASGMLPRLPGDDRDPGRRRRHRGRSVAASPEQRIVLAGTSIARRLGRLHGAAHAEPASARSCADAEGEIAADMPETLGIPAPGSVGPGWHGPGLQGIAHETQSRGARKNPVPRPRGRSAGHRPLRARDEGCRQRLPTQHRPGPRCPGNRRHARSDHGVRRWIGPRGISPPLFSSRSA